MHRSISVSPSRVSVVVTSLKFGSLGSARTRGGSCVFQTQRLQSRPGAMRVLKHRCARRRGEAHKKQENVLVYSGGFWIIFLGNCILHIYICIYVKCMRAKPLQSCPAFWGPVDYSPPGSSVHGILQAGILEWGAISSSRGSFQPRIEPASLASPHCRQALYRPFIWLHQIPAAACGFFAVASGIPSCSCGIFSCRL